MATVVNKSEGAKLFSVKGHRYLVPAAKDRKPGTLEVDDAVLQEAKKHKVVAGWFEDGALVARGEAKADPKADPKPGKPDPK